MIVTFLELEAIETTGWLMDRLEVGRPDKDQ
jgi:hypothetical protein